MTATLPLYQRRLSPASGVAIIAIVAALGLLYVKWLPYYHRAFVAAATHSIGHSILMGSDAHPPAPSLKAAIDYSLTYGKAIWQAMVLGLLLGAAVQEFFPIAWMARSLGRSTWRGVAIGGLLAIPGMMCTCCAAPVVVGLRRRSASPAAATAFWLGNTVLNPATLIFIGFVLGWQWMGLRLALGIPLVFGAGYVITRLTSPEEVAALEDTISAIAGSADDTSPSIKGWFDRFWQLSVWLVPEYVVLVLLLGAARAWIFPTVSPAIGNSLVWIVLMSAAGLVFVIPTAGEVPIVQAMLTLGVGVGPAGALLMTLAPISLPSLAMTTRAFSARVLVAIVALVFLTGVVAGLMAVQLGL